MEEAKAAYLVVARNAADSELKVKAQKALQAFEEEIPLEKKGEGFAPRMEYTLYLLPMGNTNGKILSCLQEGLKQKMHIDVKILERMPLPENMRKRNFGDRYLQNLSKEIRSQMGEDRLQLVCRSYRIDPRRLNESAVQVEFLRVVLKENPEDLRNFETEYQKYRSEFQYNVKDLLKCVEEKYNNYLKEPKTLGILGVIDRDIFENDYNFLFGWARPHLGVMSYRRFTTEFNGEPKNLQKVADRALKQGLSSAGYILGVKRCTDPDCARAYPHSLIEHDRKSTELCPQCRRRLEEVLKKLP
ncbi:MAG: archaemetzincin [bacterium]